MYSTCYEKGITTRHLLTDNDGMDDAYETEDTDEVDNENPLGNADNRQTGLSKSEPFKFLPGIEIPNNVRECLLIADRHVTFKPIEGRCKHWDCRGSQVTLVNKYMMAIIYKNFRKSVAGGNCKKFCQRRTISNMMDMKWHWALEERARMMSSRCPHKRATMSNRRLDFPGLDDDLECEVAATSTGVKEISQYALLTKLQDLLENNEMNDFEDGKYRRANANYFGCTIVMRKRMSDRTGDGETVKNSPIGHILCVFCTKENKFTSTFGTPASNCPYRTKPDKEICKLETDSKDEYSCQVQINTVCPKYEQVDWIAEYSGTLIRQAMLPIRGQKSLIPFVNTTTIAYSRSVEGNPMYTYRSTTMYNPKLKDLPIKIKPNTPRDRFEYGPVDLKGYNTSVINYTAGTYWVQSDYNYDETSGRQSDGGAVCCRWFFIVSVALLIAAIVLIIFIVRRHNQRAKNK